jgi:hypothetical protein
MQGDGDMQECLHLIMTTSLRTGRKNVVLHLAPPILITTFECSPQTVMPLLVLTTIRNDRHWGHGAKFEVAIIIIAKPAKRM